MAKHRKNFVKTSLTLARNQLAYRQLLIASDIMEREPLGALVDRAIHRALMDARRRNLDEADRLQGTGKMVDRREAEWVRARWREIGPIPSPPPRRERKPKPLPHDVIEGNAVEPTPAFTLAGEVLVEPESNVNGETPADTYDEERKEDAVSTIPRLASRFPSPTTGRIIPRLAQHGKEVDEDD